MQHSRCLPPFHLRMETEYVSETLLSLEYRTVEKVQEISNAEHESLYNKWRDIPLNSQRVMPRTLTNASEY
jgi:hypothetical protein